MITWSQTRVAQVDDQMSDAQAIGVVHLGGAGRAVRDLAGSAPDVEVGGGDDARGQGEGERREDQPARPGAEEGAGDQRDAGRDDDPGDDGIAARRGRPGPADGEHEAERDQGEAERYRAQDRSCVPFRPLTGSQPPDEEARKGDEPERHDPPTWTPAAAKGQHHADRHDEQHGAGDDKAAVGRLGGPATLALVGDEQDGGKVGQQARAAEEGQRHGADADQDGVDVEVARDAAAHAGEDAVVARAVEAARRRGGGRGLLGGRSLGPLAARPLGRGLLGARLLGGRLLGGRSLGAWLVGRRLLGARLVLVRRSLVGHREDRIVRAIHPHHWEWPLGGVPEFVRGAARPGHRGRVIRLARPAAPPSMSSWPRRAASVRRSRTPAPRARKPRGAGSGELRTGPSGGRLRPTSTPPTR